MTSLSICACFALGMPTAFACGGGGSGAYRKPLRPDQAENHSSKGAAPTSSNQKSLQAEPSNR
jgi:hypothetical protein